MGLEMTLAHVIGNLERQARCIAGGRLEIRSPIRGNGAPSPRREPSKRCLWNSQAERENRPQVGGVHQNQAKVRPKEQVTSNHGRTRGSESEDGIPGEDEGEIEIFFGQLWVVPSPLSPS